MCQLAYVPQHRIWLLKRKPTMELEGYVLLSCIHRTRVWLSSKAYDARKAYEGNAGFTTQYQLSYFAEKCWLKVTYRP